MKQIIIINHALKLPKGKLAAQVAHAAVAGALAAGSERLEKWLEAGMPKVVLKIGDEKSLLHLQGIANTAGIPNYLIRDAGKTVLEPGTVTCLGLGPDTPDKIDEITKDLKLL